MVNSYGPNGSVVYQADPNAPGGYSQTTTLSPDEQQKLNLSNQAQNTALGVANQQIGRVGEALGNQLDLSKLPGMTSGLSAGNYQTTFNPGQAVQGSVGGDLEAARTQAANAAYGQATSRLDPMWERREAQTRARLANQGFAEGSTGGQYALDQMGRDRNDAYNQAAYSSIQAGNQAAQDQFARQLAQGQFANQAAGQQYQQNMGQAQFANDAESQRLQAQIGAGTFNNQARNQALQEQAYAQNQPLNQFSALMGSGQVAMPNGIQYTPSQVGQTDVLGAYALNQQAQNAAYQAKMNQQSGLMGGLFSLGSAALSALPFSDRRLKTNIKRVGVRDDGLGVYEFDYIWGGPRQIGVMADEVRRVKPLAVHRGEGGFDRVNYAELNVPTTHSALAVMAAADGAPLQVHPKPRGRAKPYEVMHG